MKTFSSVSFLPSGADLAASDRWQTELRGRLTVQGIAGALVEKEKIFPCPLR